MYAEFIVKGSSGNEYTTRFWKEGDNITAICNCKAGENGLYCKHRFRILAGDGRDVLQVIEGNVQEVASWLPGTDIEAAMNEMMAAEAKAKKLRREATKILSAARKKLARSMYD